MVRLDIAPLTQTVGAAACRVQQFENGPPITAPCEANPASCLLLWAYNQRRSDVAARPSSGDCCGRSKREARRPRAALNWCLASRAFGCHSRQRTNESVTPSSRERQTPNNPRKAHDEHVLDDRHDECAAVEQIQYDFRVDVRDEPIERLLPLQALAPSE